MARLGARGSTPKNDKDPWKVPAGMVIGSLETVGMMATLSKTLWGV